MRWFCWLVGGFLVFSAFAAQARWQWLEAPLGAEDTVVVSARKASADGHRLDIFRRANAVYVRLTRPRSLVAMDTAHCPTLRVDDRKPVPRERDDETCSVDAEFAEFRLGTVAGDQVYSDALRGLKRGITLRAYYRLKDLGYASVEFDLGGSSGAIRMALGEGVTVKKE